MVAFMRTLQAIGGPWLYHHSDNLAEGMAIKHYHYGIKERMGKKRGSTDNNFPGISCHKCITAISSKLLTKSSDWNLWKGEVSQTTFSKQLDWYVMTWHWSFHFGCVDGMVLQGYYWPAAAFGDCNIRQGSTEDCWSCRNPQEPAGVSSQQEFARKSQQLSAVQSTVSS